MIAPLFRSSEQGTSGAGCGYVNISPNGKVRYVTDIVLIGRQSLRATLGGPISRARTVTCSHVDRPDVTPQDGGARAARSEQGPGGDTLLLDHQGAHHRH